ncbi:MAG: nicotinate-nucleotide adenylyltransferase [Planctomycetota bacterium]|nr:nicotinate-nucleotide adenylyltransferase [Planctomycetota bacterium]MEC8896173.1 nicotinate-nucleotide adenylyltransferase [Planctomycetota bacterium]
MKIGIFGGTFNPVHLGHLAVCEAVHSGHELDSVLLLPSGSPPHKQGHSQLAAAHHRLEMVRIAAEGIEFLEPCAVEIERSGPSYMVDTLEILQERHQGDELFLVVGGDTVGELPTWYCWQRLFALARVVSVNRPGFDPGFEAESFPGISEEALQQCRADRIEMEEVDISSTRVRELAAAGGDFSSWVPPAVVDYIAAHSLFSS